MAPDITLDIEDDDFSYTRASATTQVRLLLGRNWKMKTRMLKETLFEVFTPVVMFITIAFMKIVLPETVIHKPQHFHAFEPAEYTENVFGLSQPIQFVPHTASTEKIMRRVAHLLPGDAPIKGFNNTMEAQRLFELGGVFGTVVFNMTEEATDLTKDITYTLRMDGTKLPYSSPLRAVRPGWPTESTWFRYQDSGFLAAQHAVDHAVIEYQRCLTRQKCSEIDYHVKINRYPTPEYIVDEFYDQFKYMSSVYTMAGFLSLKSGFITSIVAEKEMRLKDSMLMMGLREWVLFVTWCFTYFVLAIFPTSFIMFLSWALGFLRHTPLWYLCLLMFAFVQSTIQLSYFMSTFFSKARSAGQVGTIMYLMMFGPAYFVSYNTPQWVVFLLNLMPPTAFSNGFRAIIRAESQNKSASFFGSGDEKTHNMQLSYLQSLMMLCLDFVLYCVLALYFEKVWPRDYGIARHPLFCLRPDYWRRNKKAVKRGRYFQENDEMMYDSSIEVEPVEPEVSQRECVEIYNLRKTYDMQSVLKQWLKGFIDWVPALITRAKGLVFRRGYQLVDSMDALSDSEPEIPIRRRSSGAGQSHLVEGDEVHAVRGINLSFYRGQILALLGHNGAGKSTTISMMTGLLQPTSGGVRVFGYDFDENIDEIRTQIGVCPQHDLLFEYMTIEEHLLFFGGIKGVPASLIMEESNSLISRLGLDNCRAAWAGRLSGGERRKLSVAISLIGKPKVVYFDEPTAGMDPYSRRRVWELFNEEKHKRVIILTTHYMDEADLLGDRIAIMASGKVRCVGSSLFLKKRFGRGYHLYLSESQAVSSEKNAITNGEPDQGETPNRTDTHTAAAPKSWDIFEVERHVKRILPQASMNRDSSAQISFSIPMECVSSFNELFIHLDEHKDTLRIGSYGVSLTSLEEVFLKIAMEAEEEENAGSDRSESSDSGDERFLLEGRQESMDDGTGVFHNEEKDFSIDVEMANLDREEVDSESEVDEDTTHLLKRPKSVSFSKTLQLSRGAKYDQQLRAMVMKKVTQMRRSLHTYFFKLFWPFAYVSSLLTAMSSVQPLQSISPPLMPLTKTMDTLYRAVFGDYQVPLAGATQSILTNLATMMAPSNFTSNSTFVGSPATGQIETFLDHSLSAHTNSTMASLAAEQFNLDTGSAHLTMFHNNSVSYMSPVMLSSVGNAVSGILTDGSITAFNQPYPYPQSTNFNDMNALMMPMMFGIAFPMIADGFGLDAMREKSSRAKHQLLVMGLRPWVYWAGNIVFDMTFFLIPVMFTFGFFEWFGQHDIMGDAFPASFALFVSYGFGAISFSYLLSQWFSRARAYQAFTTTIQRFLCMILFMGCVMLDRMDQFPSDSIGFAIFKGICCLIPQFSLQFGLFQVLVMNQDIRIAKERCQLIQSPTCDVPDWKDFFSFHMMGGTMVVLIVSGFAYLILTVVVEYRLFRGCSVPPPVGNRNDTEPLPNEDDDVHNERLRMRSEDIPGETIRCVNVRKYYPLPGLVNGRRRVKLALGKLTLGVQAGERFGLLGPNGAGKTTLVNIMTGSNIQTMGNCEVGGHNVYRNIFDVYKKIGLCPQADALDEFLTGREHLVMYARIKGIPEHDIDHAVDNLLSLMDLHKYADRKASKYSGGNKRKLNVAISLMARPQIAMLDEPSTGMDPVSRRRLWDTILTEMKEQSIILTTHSMEEAEALCSRIGIMVNGVLKCLGTPQHLKSIHGKGYQIEIRLVRPDPVLVDRCEKFMKEVVPQAELVENVSGRLRFTMEKVDLSLSKIFGELEKGRTECSIEDYSVSQATLEQVFINFAKVQEEPVVNTSTGEANEGAEA